MTDFKVSDTANIQRILINKVLPLSINIDVSLTTVDEIVAERICFLYEDLKYLQLPTEVYTSVCSDITVHPISLLQLCRWAYCAHLLNKKNVTTYWKTIVDACMTDEYLNKMLCLFDKFIEFIEDTTVDLVEDFEETTADDSDIVVIDLTKDDEESTTSKVTVSGLMYFMIAPPVKSYALPSEQSAIVAAVSNLDSSPTIPNTGQHETDYDLVRSEWDSFSEICTLPKNHLDELVDLYGVENGLINRNTDAFVRYLEKTPKTPATDKTFGALGLYLDDANPVVQKYVSDSINTLYNFVKQDKMFIEPLIGKTFGNYPPTTLGVKDIARLYESAVFSRICLCPDADPLIDKSYQRGYTWYKMGMKDYLLWIYCAIESCNSGNNKLYMNLLTLLSRDRIHRIRLIHIYIDYMDYVDKLRKREQETIEVKEREQVTV